MIKFIEQMFMTGMAYTIAYIAGLMYGNGVDLPWAVDAGFYAAFTITIVICGELKKNE